MRRSFILALALTAVTTACQPPEDAVNQPPNNDAQAAPETASPAAGNAAPSAPGSGTPPVRLAEGQYLVDASGRAVYALEGNTGGSKCDATCEAAWPPVLTESAVGSQAPGLQPGLLSSQPRADGAAQVVYAGHPLYRYAGDQGATSTSGDGVKDQWGTWHLVSSAGTFVSGSAKAQQAKEQPHN
jgi:predicted lipoprotein with Yx(FWY)xxD motif